MSDIESRSHGRHSNAGRADLRIQHSATRSGQAHSHALVLLSQRGVVISPDRDSARHGSFCRNAIPPGRAASGQATSGGPSVTGCSLLGGRGRRSSSGYRSLRPHRLRGAARLEVAADPQKVPPHAQPGSRPRAQPVPAQARAPVQAQPLPPQARALAQVQPLPSQARAPVQVQPLPQAPARVRSHAPQGVRPPVPAQPVQPQAHLP